MAKASGRRAAHYIVDKYRQAFDNNDAQPPVPVSLIGP